MRLPSWEMAPPMKEDEPPGQEMEQAEPPVPEDLKNVDPERLDPETTDFSRFLKDDVPERLRRAALRRLWSSDETLANLAQLVAQRVAATGRSFTLEPMPPNERRVVHLALADYDGVSTASSGEGDGRRVTVEPSEE